MWDAIDAMLLRQRQIVDWWEATVRMGRPKVLPSPATLLAEDAERLIGLDKTTVSQQQIVDWWTANVRGTGNPQLLPSPATITATDAERLIGLDKTTVSRFRKALQDIPAYRQRLSDRFPREAAAHGQGGGAHAGLAGDAGCELTC
jgi:hypothetical protein